MHGWSWTVAMEGIFAHRLPLKSMRREGTLLTATLRSITLSPILRPWRSARVGTAWTCSISAIFPLCPTCCLRRSPALSENLYRQLLTGQSRIGPFSGTR